MLSRAHLQLLAREIVISVFCFPRKFAEISWLVSTRLFKLHARISILIDQMFNNSWAKFWGKVAYPHQMVLGLLLWSMSTKRLTARHVKGFWVAAGMLLEDIMESKSCAQQYYCAMLFPKKSICQEVNHVKNKAIPKTSQNMAVFFIAYSWQHWLANCEPELVQTFVQASGCGACLVRRILVEIGPYLGRKAQ